MSHSQFDLLRDRRFLPLFVTQFLGAFNDNIFKNALVGVLVFAGAAVGAEGDPNTKILATLATGIFILPYLLLSALVGQLADKYPKDKVIRATKLAEIAVVTLAVISLLSGSLVFSFVTLFLLGVQSSFYSPSKFSILPQLLHEDELIGGNALLSTGTFLAILFGTICGLGLATVPGGVFIISAILVVVALGGYMASRKIPLAPAGDPDLKISYNIVRETINILHHLFTDRRSVAEAALGVAWFWFLGAAFLSQIPNFTKEILGANEHVVILFMVLFSIGIGFGGLLNNRLLRGRVEAVYVPLAALGITVFSIDLYFAGHGFAKAHPPAELLMGLEDFVATLSGWRIIVDLCLIAAFSGMFVVPLNAIIQHDTHEDVRSRIMAGSALLNSVFVVASSVLSAGLLAVGVSIPALFLIYALMNMAVAFYICQLLPDYLLKTLMQIVFKLFYKVEIRGLENFEKAGKRAIIVGNHVSLLDAPILAAFLPGRPMFAVNSFVAEWFWVRPFLKMIDAFPLDPGNPFSIKSLIKEVEKDKHCVIFPEGRLTETGALMKIYEGPGMIADKAEAMILPIRLDGVQHTPFSRLKGKVPIRTFPKITITILEPRSFKIPDSYKGRQRRAVAARQLYDLMENMMFMTNDREQTLYQALMKARHVNGDNAVILEDVQRRPMKFRTLVQGSVLLGRKLARHTGQREAVGLMLPNTRAAVVSFFALQLCGRVPAMLNFSAGAKAILSACRSAQIKCVVTSRRFIEVGRLENLIDEMQGSVKILYLEDLQKSITPLDKVSAVLNSPARIHARQKVKPQDAAVILFTSGSEGAPKGVVLSHANIMSNIVQLSCRVDFSRQDIVFNALPMFHSFGLTGGTLLPVLSGVRTFLYPSPLHYRIVPELVYSSNATIMFGTDTFLRGYARMADPYDFYRMRYIFAGAEKVRDDTRKTYADRFGVRILEGYGATETSPALTLNSPMHAKDGTVGRILCGIEYMLEPVPGVNDGGRLFVRGPNIMSGYYREEQPGILQPPAEGWYDTGDIVHVDEEGYVKILGRAKRFAKIAGEMVSLASVETMVNAVYPAFMHAVVAMPDAKKGEQLVLVTTNPALNRAEISRYAAEHGISELAVPKMILPLDKMPVLGSGKTDYAEVTSFVKLHITD